MYHAVGVYTYGICVEDMYRVCLRGIRMDVTLGWSIGVRYIYLISVILNVYGGYIYNYNSLTACFTLLIPYSYLSLRCMCDFGSQFTLACGLRFLVDLYGQLEECCN